MEGNVYDKASCKMREGLTKKEFTEAVMKKKDKKITALFMTFCIILGLLSLVAPDWSV